MKFICTGGTTINPKITDYGPGKCCNNDVGKGACTGAKMRRIIDLTPAAFVAMGGNLATGINPVKLTA